MRPLGKRKITAVLASAVGAAVLALGTLAAGAVAAPSGTFTTTSDGPQSANIPYVAWVGEHVRLVACDPAIAHEEGSQSANFQLEDWSGKPETAEIPEQESGTQACFAPSTGSPQAESKDGCVKVDYKSLAPGLARIRAVVTNKEGTILYSHQFLVIWLTANKPTLTELPSGGDPSGNGEFTPSPFSEPGAGKGLVQVKVTGSFPVEEGSLLHNILPGGTGSEPGKDVYQLPTDWATLAAALASSAEEKEPPGSNPGLWDIHGSPGEGTNSSVSGPFDPEATETLLSNGSLNADDAPMPAIRVDVHLAPNTEGGLGGVGQISGAPKTVVYSNNPYYTAYIPATERLVPQASGIDGPKHGGSFPGFLNGTGPYTFWTSVLTSGNREGGSTGCLQRTQNGVPSYYQTPSGSLNETFYTDERGEVLVSYSPGDDFYFNHIPVFGGAEGESETGKIVKNADGGCDLKGMYKEVIGESSLSATVLYPYQPVDFGPQTSNTVVKKVRSLWEKEFFEFPKGNGKEEQNVRIVVAKAQDIDGRPIVGEEVCFHAQQEAGLYQFSNPTNGNRLEDPAQLLGKGTSVYLGGSRVTDPEDEGSGKLCVTTNEEGLAAIDVVNSTSSSVDMTVRYENEAIVRDHLVEFPGNIGSKEEQKEDEAEEKAAQEKKAAEETAEAAEDEAELKERAKEREEAEAKADEAEDQKIANEQTALEERVKRETQAEEARVKREQEAEKRQGEKEKAKEEFEKRTAEEIKTNSEKRATEEAAEKARREAEAAAEAKRRAEEVAAHKVVVEKSALVSPIAGALSGTSHGKAHVASKKKARKAKKRHKK